MGGGGSRMKHLRAENPNNNWSIEKDLGAGTYGKVHLVKHRESGILAAAKVAELQGAEMLINFQDEVAILAGCQHVGMTNFVDGYFYDNTLWILIEVCGGGSLDSIIRKRKHGLDEVQCKCVSAQMLAALEYLHSRFIIHRDINASNTLLADGGIVKLADFGVSAKCRGEGQRRQTFIGTPNWMAPEVVACENDKAVSYGPSVDVWSLGITLVELVQMVPPYNDLHPMKVLFKIASAKPATFDHPEELSEPANQFLAACLVKDQAQRPSASRMRSHDWVRGVQDPRPLKLLYQDPMASSPTT